MRILAGDIGGTNTRLSIWERSDPAQTPKQVGPIAKFKNAGAKSFDETLASYLAGLPNDVVKGVTDACFGVAGPVEGRQVSLTNIPHWPAIHADAIARTLEINDLRRVSLINDMPAHGASLASIEAIAPDHVIPLNAGQVRADGTRAIVMPGTGLGIGMLVWESAGRVHRPIPTEGGHADLPARDDVTRSLIASMKKIYSSQMITREHVLSGPGLRAIYACLKNPESPRIDAAPKGELYAELEATDEIARQSLQLFTTLLAELCGNIAFEYLATGGIYLGGSIATSLRSRLSSRLFNEVFIASGPPSMHALIRSVPIKLVIYEETGLLGAATYASWVADGRI